MGDFRQLVSIARETHLQLRRDRIFPYSLILILMLCFAAGLVSQWNMEMIVRAFFSINAFSFHWLGGVIAVLWGAKAVKDAQEMGFIEMQLAAPISRSSWLLGKYLGIMGSLLMIAVFFAFCANLASFANGYGVLGLAELVVFKMFFIEWAVLAALVMFFSCVAGRTVAMFSALGCWVLGLISQPIAAGIEFLKESTTFSNTVIRAVAWVWDLQRFNVSDIAFLNAAELPWVRILWHSFYGLMLVVFFLVASIVAFRRQELK